MNNIYKVIWSKAKNCYVVASEIARSHTKSATGSEKIGGVTRRSLLASLMALSLLCGGLGVASAANGTVHVAESSASSDPAVYTTEKVNTLLNDYGKKTDVEDNKNNIATLQNTTTTQGQKITENATNIARNTADIAKKIDMEMADERFAAKVDLTALQNQVTGKVDENTFEDALYDKADKTYVDTKLDGKADKATTLAGYGINDAYTKDATNTAITTKVNEEKNARELKDAELSGRIDTLSTTVDSKVSKTDLNTTLGNYYTQAETNAAIKTAVDDEKNARENAINGEVTSRNKAIADAIALEETKRDAAITKEETKRKEEDAKLEGKITENTTAINNEKAVREAADIDLSKRIGTVAENGNYIEKDKNVSDNLVKLDNQAKANAEAITKTNQRTAGITRDDTRKETSIEGKVTVDTNGNIKAEGTITSNGLDAKSGDIKTNGKVSAGDISTGTLETTGNATIGGNLDVTGTLNIKDVTAETIYISKSEENTHYKSEGSIIGEGGNLSVSNKKFDKRNNITKESQLNVDEEGTVNWATSTDATGNKTEGRSEVTADNIKNSVKKTEGGKTFGYEENITAGGKGGTVTDKAGNTTYTKVTATENSFQIRDKDGKNKNHQVNTKDSSVTEITNGDGKTTKTEQTATDITNTAKDGTVTNDANHIVNNANTMDTTVTGKATESYGELETTVNGKETHTVTGNQDIHVTGKQTNTVGGGQINNITGGQKNNILTGNQETTVSDGSIINKAEHGDISNTAKNVTNEGTESVTNKVGTNEVKVSQDGVDIKAGDMTVTTDKTTGTTFGNGTPKDITVINGGTIGTNKVNANETNTKKLTAGAAADAEGGRLTVDANDGVKGSYKSAKYTSRSYILENTLKSGVDNDKEPIEDGFVGSRTDHYMEGDKAKLDETVKDAAGSNVTNKTSTGTVTTITDGTTTTKTEQTESMVQSYVGKKDGSATNVTTNFANASENMVTEDGKTSTVLNNKDGLLVRNTANGKSFNTADGTNTGTALEWTNVKGNEISTGKVEANYVKMDYADVMQDLGVRGNAKIAGKTTTGSLEVTGTSTLTGDVTMGSNATVTKDLSVGGTTTTKTLNVTENATVGGTLDVTQKATFHDDVDITKNLSVGGNATITGDVTAKSYKVDGKTYIDANGIHANDQKITNVADGSISEGSKDAVNGGQLYNVKNDLEGKVNKVGANAAAMANLHPMEFDPDSKWNIAAAIGNYGSETAAALGAFYRPNDDVMVNLSTAFGTGENMVGGGVSVRLGKGGNKLSREESNALKDQVNDLTARMDALLSVLNPNMSKDFPDVPKNHWAYEAVSRLAGNDIVQGYPDGEFHGERTMTRYEMAEIIYNALSRGAEAEKELVEEFKPELQAMAASEKATAERAEG